MSFVAVSVESSSPYGAARFAVGPYGEEDSTSRRWKALEDLHLGGRELGENPLLNKLGVREKIWEYLG